MLAASTSCSPALAKAVEITPTKLFPSQQRWEETSLPGAHGKPRGSLWEGTRSSLAAGQARGSREPWRQESSPACACAKGSPADDASPSPCPSVTVTLARSPRTCLRSRKRTGPAEPTAGSESRAGPGRMERRGGSAAQQRRARCSPGIRPAVPLTSCRGASGPRRPFGAQSPLCDGPGGSPGALRWTDKPAMV